MKIKNFIQKNLKRVFVVILSFVLIISCALPAWAMDGEIGGIDKNILDEYDKFSYVLFNPRDLPVFSPLNFKFLNFIANWPIAGNGSEAFETEYLTITCEQGGLYYTYYFVPDVLTDKSWADMFVDSMFDFSDLYVKFFADVGELTADGQTLNCTNRKSFVEHLSDYSIHIDAMIYYNCYVYMTVRSSEHSLLSFSSIAYTSYIDAMNIYTPNSNICQITYESASSNGVQVDMPSFLVHESVENNNLNYLFSVSTYSVTSYKYFEDDLIEDTVSAFDLEFTYNITKDFDKHSFYVPESIRGPNFPSDTDYLYFSAESQYYYLKEGYLSTERAYLILPYSASEMGTKSAYVFVFSSDVSPLLYFRTVSTTSSSVVYLQVLSKVDYELYSATKFLGSFDAETTTFHCNYQSNDDRTTHARIFASSVDATLTSMVADSDYKTYPVIKSCVYGSAGVYKKQFQLNGLNGNKTALSIFPSQRSMIGSYVYVSPDLRPEIVVGNTGLPGSPITPGGAVVVPNGDFWDLEFDGYDDILDFDMTAPPNFDYLKTLNFGNIWNLPENAIRAFIEIIDWLAENFERFLEQYSEPTHKIFVLAGTILNFSPNLFKFIFIFSIICSLAMKLLQYSSASITQINMMSKSSSMDSHGSNRSKESKEKEKKKRKAGDE